MVKMTRRNFLKTAAATGVASTSLKFSFNEYSKAAANAEVEKRHTLCNGCSNMCGLFVYVKNGRVVKAEGNPIHLKNKGKICARGHGMVADIYNPDRVTRPMKRVGEQEFEPISWEQAFSEIGEKLTGIIDEHSANSVTWLEHGVRGKNYADIFLDYIGSPNYITHYATCFSSKTNVWSRMMATNLFGDHENSDYMLFVGRNFAGGIIPNGMRKVLKATRERGAKLVVVDPRCCELAKVADEWIPIKPGTDLAFFLAIAHVLVTEDLKDRKFTREYVENFEEFWNANRNCTPEWAEEITDVPADKIREIARDLAKHAPKAFLETGYHGLNAHYQNSVQQAQMNVIINALLGNMYQRGGLLPSASVEFGQFETKRPPEKEKGPRVDGAGEEGPYATVEAVRGIPQRVPQLVEEGKIKALFIYHYNPLRTCPDPEYQKKIKDADLVVSMPIDWNETSLYTADYILPECYFMERAELPVQTSGHITHDYPQIAMRTEVVEPMEDTKPLLDIMKGIAKEIGAEEYFDFTVDDWAKAMIEPLGVTLEHLKEAGCIEFRNQGIDPKFPLEGGEPALNTPSGKVEFSVGLYKVNGFSGVPRWIPPKVEPKRQDEFRLIHGKQPWHSHHITSNNPYLMAISEQYDATRMWINKERADKLGIKTGDTVTVESEIAKKEVEVKATELLHPDCVWVPSAYGGFSKKAETAYGVGINWNDFLPAMVEPIAGSTMGQEVIVRVRKEGK
ncbi:respiratory selenite reductase catalytic subunit SrrA [Natroniella sulfidigena]|uniref:respiratory selenite reductase catalytic subunit SrrA n=1 Tax=Natroniella sulfidigena TaxID=723921 RepID=UPI00200A231B|nr:respiratory selenite reductase catalytic subunit SrrA [Natroniella sulfidigena]MCK8817020.1 respiratory selenite reductase catalytic subunit SrrA [Natroniella sulfidigena]